MTRSYRDCLKDAKLRLHELPADEAESDSWLLFSAAFQMDFSAYLLHQLEEAPKEGIGRLEDYLRQRLRRRPAAYILGSCGFFDLDFYVDERVLIPRQDTECLLEEALVMAARSGRTELSLLDLCTGSGCLAVCLAHRLPGAAVWATDLSEGALELARRNAEANGVTLQLAQGDLFEALPAGLLFDGIVSNPPYVTAEEYQTLQPEIIGYEPEMALLAEEEGLAFYRRIAQEAPAYLRPSGFLCLEIGETQAEAVCQLLKEQGVYEDPMVILDLGGQKRVVRTQLSEHV